MARISDIIALLGNIIPVSYQESYDNSGLQVGDPNAESESAILSLDVTDEVIDEAVSEGARLIISHHPVIFGGLKRLTGNSQAERIVIKAIKNNIAIYSAHTNLDVIPGGVSFRLAQKLGVKNPVPLVPLSGKLAKIAVFVPSSHVQQVRNEMFAAGAGNIGNYDHCSFNSEGTGTFRADETANPFTGRRGEDHTGDEIKIEVIMPRYLVPSVTKAMTTVHPYEEIAFDVYNLENSMPGAGMGVVGNLDVETPPDDFLEMLSETLGLGGLRYGRSKAKSIKRVALCGGSGSSLIDAAISSGADAYITGDIKYHSFLEAEGNILLADIGHYESEKFSLEILYEIITKKFPKFAVRFSKINTNPVNYLPTWKK